MNVLDISIVNPYTNKETTLPIKGEKTCVTPFVELTLNVQAADNEKGYVFNTKPCMCYNTTDNRYDFSSESIEEVINHNTFVIMQNEVMNGDYSACTNCSKLNRDFYRFMDYDDLVYTYDKFGKRVAKKFMNKETDYVLPYQCYVSIDVACNLACKTCRNDNAITQYIDITEEDTIKLLNLLEQFEVISVGSNGETFFSKIYRRILQHDFSSSNVKSIVIFTNGTLLNQKAWESIHPNNRKLIKEIKISIDAASEETYKNTRNKNLWPQLMENIKFLNSIKKEYGFTLHSTFTASIYNYKDTIAFYDFSKSIGFDRVQYQFARPIFVDQYRTVDVVLKPEVKECIRKELYELFGNDDIVLLDT